MTNRLWKSCINRGSVRSYCKVSYLDLRSSLNFTLSSPILLLKLTERSSASNRFPQLFLLQTVCFNRPSKRPLRSPQANLTQHIPPHILPSSWSPSTGSPNSETRSDHSRQPNRRNTLHQLEPVPPMSKEVDF